MATQTAAKPQWFPVTKYRGHTITRTYAQIARPFRVHLQNNDPPHVDRATLPACKRFVDRRLS